MMRAQTRDQIQKLTGLTDTSGVEVISMVRTVMNLLDGVTNLKSGQNDISGPRWGLLLCLIGEEQRGKKDGITPTLLSRYQSVSKNTISSLLRGLEDQGYIQRALDPVDHRIFRIQLTPAGREFVKTTSPKRMIYLNQLVSGLTDEEHDQLITLLEKLYCSMLKTSNASKE
ncbi:MAG: winged helix DNA-binding protein [Anaerolineaceae bacterium]|nr:winged helix DNA-binding protein [Anaerolineaceae bacterium]